MSKIVYGYIRVSTKEQNEDRQKIALAEFPVAENRIFLDKLSGKDFERPQYKKLMKKLRTAIFSLLSLLTGWAEIMKKF